MTHPCNYCGKHFTTLNRPELLLYGEFFILGVQYQGYFCSGKDVWLGFWQVPLPWGGGMQRGRGKWSMLI